MLCEQTICPENIDRLDYKICDSASEKNGKNTKEKENKTEDINKTLNAKNVEFSVLFVSDKI